MTDIPHFFPRTGGPPNLFAAAKRIFRARRQRARSERELRLQNRRGLADIGLWRIEVSDGKPQGQPQLVKSAMGRMSPVEMTPNGKLFYKVLQGSEDVYIAELAPETGSLLAPSKPASNRFLGLNSREISH